MRIKWNPCFSILTLSCIIQSVPQTVRPPRETRLLGKIPTSCACAKHAIWITSGRESRIGQGWSGEEDDQESWQRYDRNTVGMAIFLACSRSLGELFVPPVSLPLRFLLYRDMKRFRHNVSSSSPYFVRLHSTVVLLVDRRLKGLRRRLRPKASLWLSCFFATERLYVSDFRSFRQTDFMLYPVNFPSVHGPLAKCRSNLLSRKG